MLRSLTLAALAVSLGGTASAQPGGEPLGGEPEVRFTGELYLAGPNEVESALRPLPDEVDTAMVLGHNNGWEEVVAWLSRNPVTMTTANAALLSVEAQAPLAPSGEHGGGGGGGAPARAVRAARLVAAGLRGFHAHGDGVGAGAGRGGAGGPRGAPGPLGGSHNPGLAPAPGRAVWGLRVDCAVQSDAGGLATCLSRASKAALLDARIPRATVEETVFS